MDILGASGFINYFGKWADLNDVTIPPLVFNKGKTFVSVYGLSYMNDQRLSRLLRDDKVCYQIFDATEVSRVGKRRKIFFLFVFLIINSSSVHLRNPKLLS